MINTPYYKQLTAIVLSCLSLSACNATTPQRADNAVSTAIKAEKTPAVQIATTNGAEQDAIMQRVRKLLIDIKELKNNNTRPKEELNGYLTKLNNIAKAEAEGKQLIDAPAILSTIETALATELVERSFKISTIKPEFLYSKDGLSKLPLKAGMSLTPNDFVKVSFDVTQTEFVYVLYEDAAGKCTLLNPEKEYKEFEKGSHQIPLALEFFSLENEKLGQQKIVVRSSARPLSQPTDCSITSSTCENCVHTLSFSIAKD